MIQFQNTDGDMTEVIVEVKPYPSETIIVNKKFDSFLDMMDHIMNTYWFKVGKNRRLYT